MRVFGLPAGFARLAKYSRNHTEELSEKALFKWQVLELLRRTGECGAGMRTLPDQPRHALPLEGPVQPPQGRLSRRALTATRTDSGSTVQHTAPAKGHRTAQAVRLG